MGGVAGIKNHTATLTRRRIIMQKPLINKDTVDRVLKDYMHGKYFDKKAGTCIPLTNKINKYNMQFIRDVNEINSKFKTLRILNNITLKLLDNCIGRDMSILLNHNKAYIETIKYMAALKDALKKYALSTPELVYSMI